MELEALKQAAICAGDDDVLELIASHTRLLAALKAIFPYAQANYFGGPDADADFDLARAALAATGAA